MPTKQKRILYFDILNILACIAVIFLHHNGLVWNYDGSSAWKQSLIIEVICYFAVPIFLMLSGATLLDYRKRYDTKTFFKKRFTKILIPFLFWATIMFVWKISLGELSFSGPRSIVNAFFTNAEQPIFYFMFLILGIYLAMPIFSKIIEKDAKGGRKVLWYAVIIIFITQSLLPLLLNFIGITWNSQISSQITTLMIFVFLGYLLRDAQLNKRSRVILYIIAILCCVFRYSITYILSSDQGALVNIFFDYGQFHAIILSSAVFVFIKQIRWQNLFKTKTSQNIIKKIASCSFGIYLIHMIFMYYEMYILNLNDHSIIWRLLMPCITYLCTLGCVLLLKKIPIFKKLVP